MKRPSSSSDEVAITYDSNGRTSSIVIPGHTTNYAWSLAGTALTAVALDSTGTIRTSTADTAKRVILTSKDALNRQSSYTYDTYGRLASATYPEGNKVQLTYDARGNVTEQRQVSKTAGTPGDVVASAGFDASCTNRLTCNQPNWTKDALGNQTDYTYDTTYGGVLSMTQPAATVGGTRPQTRYSYTQMKAYYSNGSAIVGGQTVSRITGASTCLTSASCAGAAEEAKVAIGYGPQTAGVGNNLLPVSTTVQSGDNAVVATTAIAYDAVGNATAVDGPLAGTADTTAYRYDALRRPVGVISADPDGGGALPNIAARTTYDAKGRVTLSEQGTTAGQSDAAWSGFTPAASVAATYDNADRKLTEALKNGTTTYQLTQYSYDARGRLDCAASRMNPAIYGSLPASACTLGTAGTFGSDRITKTTYDAADQVTQAQRGYGTADVSAEVSTVYTSNGLASYVTDALNNRTTYEYDGHDRLVKTRYPVPAIGSNASSTTDYEQLTYGDNVRVTQRRLRDGNTISLGYDNLSRVTGISGTNIPTRSLAYNLLGMRTSATFTSSGQSVANGYDALGRMVSETTPQGTVGYQYDSASRRTRITWPDTLWVSYDYDVTGKITAVREYGATSGLGQLATYAYDSLGRRMGVSYGNGTQRTYNYDGIGRLTGLSIDPAGTSKDVVIGAVGGTGTALGYNPASQITSLARSNDSYAFTESYNVNRAYTRNGLNQYTASGATALGYDGRGNLTSSGTATYAYNGLNQMTSANTGTAVALTYDPADRLYQANVTRFQYDGGNIIAEYNTSNTLQRRFVPGPGVDETVAWYEGAGTASRRWLQTDERGSVVNISDAAGATLAINRYDEYGIPASTNTGRFQYTGQAWLSSIGLYYYKARMYSPTLGRFMQTDPIGYADGMNWYNYVGGDPVNGTDPSGMDDGEIVVSRRRLTRDGGGGGGGGGSFAGFGFSMGNRGGGFAGRGGPGGGGIAGGLGAIGGSNPAMGSNSDDEGQDPPIIVTAPEPENENDIVFVGQLNGLQTYGNNPFVGRPVPLWYPNGRINTDLPGGLSGAWNDLDRIAQLNGITPPSNSNPVEAAANGWVPSYNPKSGYTIITHTSGLEIRFNGANLDTRITIPVGLLIGHNLQSTYLPETIHYKGP